MSRRAKQAAAAGAVLLLWALFSGTLLAWRLFFFAVCWYGAIGLLRYRWVRSLDCSVELRSVGGIHEGLFDISYVFANNGLLPIPRCMISLQLERELGAMRSEPEAVSFGGGELKTLKRRFSCPRRGVYTVGGALVEVPDLLGVGMGTATFDKRLTVEVYPREYPLSQRDAGYLGTSGAMRSAGGRPEDVGDLERIRPIQPGEAPRHINWKATARTEMLQVMEYTAHSRRGVVVLLDSHQDKYAADREGRIEERCVEVALGLTGFWLRRGIPVLLSAGGQRLWLEGQAGLETARRMLMLYEPGTAPMLQELKAFDVSRPAGMCLRVVSPELTAAEALLLGSHSEGNARVYLVTEAPASVPPAPNITVIPAGQEE